MRKIEEVAAKISCDFILNPADDKYVNEHIREFQGCPTVAVTKGGRIYAGWYTGGFIEPHMDNFNLLVKSDDGGKTWSKPLLVIPSNKENLVHALDIQLFTAPDGRLFVYWVQNNVKPADAVDEEGKPLYTGHTVAGYIFNDSTHAMWYSVCENPDDDEPKFSEPKYADTGFLRCKPLVLSDGRWLCCNYDQLSERYGYSFSEDNGMTYKRYYGAKKIRTPFDETMAYEMKNGDIRMLARAEVTGTLAETTSHDGGYTWDETKESNIATPNTRFYISRTPSGRILLVHNNDAKERKIMTVCLSDDDGMTFPYSVCIDERTALTYPDCDFLGDKIVLVYDHGRCHENEILFTSFTEEDIISGKKPEITIISKP